MNEQGCVLFIDLPQVSTKLVHNLHIDVMMSTYNIITN